MKKLGVLMMGMVLGMAAWAQTFDEWFKQKKTQISYLNKQIAALEALIQVTEKGYQLVGKGMRLISDTKEGDRDLHTGYFSSLLDVNPVVRQNPAVIDILNLQDQILAVGSQAKQIGVTLPAWLAVIQRFYDGLVAECGEDLEKLSLLITDGSVQMTVNERLTAIDRLDIRMKKRVRDAMQARNDIIVLASNYGQ